MYSGSLAVTGENSCTLPFSMHTEPEFLALIKILREADVAFTHLEMLIHECTGYPLRPFELGFPLHAPPKIADELKWAGIDIASCANNHSLEWGENGLLDTIKHLDRAGIVNAGIGKTLVEAREPHYLMSKNGRVALISISSGHHPYDSASLPNPPVRGRPGVNPLRVTLKYVLDHDSAEKLKEIWKKLGLSSRPRRYMTLEEGEFALDLEHVYESYIESFKFGVSDEFAVLSIPNQWDIEGNIRSIKEARRQADLVLVSHHNASADGSRGFKPSTFIPPFAKKCIDAGADMYIGHGWHRELGIEIYKNKPIFYGKGNFFSQFAFNQRIPSDTYEGTGFDLNNLPTLTPADFHDLRRPGVALDRASGSIALLELEKGELSELKLYPYSLGADWTKNPEGEAKRMIGTRFEGRPMLADRENSKIILDNVKQLSAAYGTHIEFKDGIGVVKLK